MKLNKFLIYLLLLTNLNALGQKDVREIVKRSDEILRGTSLQADMTFKIVRPKYTREMTAKVWTKGTDYSLILILSPLKDKGAAYLKRKKEVWSWLPVLERVMKLPPSMMSQSWMGTDFTNDDLVKESSTVDDYNHTLIGADEIDDRDCYKIEMKPKPQTAVIWDRVILWIDKKDYLQLKSEFYDEDGNLLNTLLGKDIKQMDDRFLPTRLEMIPADKPGHKTVIVYNSMLFNRPIKDNFFTSDNMKIVK
jgi:outer membrane lipoprotein-sorting protein